jgi:small subunit ribosomal protein S9
MSKAITKVIHASGKRKRAIARATLTPADKHTVHVNGVLLVHYGNMLTRARVLEPVQLSGALATRYAITVTTSGGGSMGQADAARLAIARALATVDENLRPMFLEYDRQLMVADVRRKESAKPNSHGQARSKTQKSYR